MRRPIIAVLVSLAVPGPSGAQTRPPPGDLGTPTGCHLCHGELELLRQHVATLEEARAIFVPAATIAGSAHDTMSCRSCHRGFEPYPHPERRSEGAAGSAAPEGGFTASCASCHEDAEEAWTGSIHERGDGRTDCSACHGAHDVLPLEALSETVGVVRMNATCVDCHDTAALPAGDPHADTVACTSCHRPHATEAADLASSAVAPLSQDRTCGACHGEVADSARSDVHGRALAEAAPADLATLEHEGPDGPPACTSCHSAHGMLAASDARFDREMVEECAACHADYGRSYFGTYHGKATAAGSEIVATCDHCHEAHRILPADHPASAVAGANLVETCGACHEHARPAFVEYDSHPDPMDRSRNGPLFYSFVFMNVLLFGTLGVFGLHTALWWVRLMIDRAAAGEREGSDG